MPSAAKITTYGLTKQVWPQKALYQGIIEASPALGLIRKDETLTQPVRWVSIGYGTSEGIGRTFPDAKQYKSASKSVQFSVSTREIYGTFSIDGKLRRTWEYGKNDAILIDPIKREGDNLLRAMRNKLSRALWNNGVAALAQMTSASSPTTSLVITLRSGADLRNFTPNMPVQLESTGVTGGTVKLGVLFVASIGTFDNPTVTFQATGGATKITDIVPSAMASDFLYAVGTYDNGFLLGFEAWNPIHTGGAGSATPAGTFLGVDRNQAPEWLAGSCLDGRGKSVSQRIYLASGRLAELDRKMDIYFLSTRSFMTLALEQGTNVRYVKAPAAPIGKYKFGIEYTGIEVAGVMGPIRVFPDAWMPDNVERGGELDTISLASMGPLIHWDDGNSPNEQRTEDGADAIEVRAVGDPAFINEFPGAWCRVQTA